MLSNLRAFEFILDVWLQRVLQVGGARVASSQRRLDHVPMQQSRSVTDFRELGRRRFSGPGLTGGKWTLPLCSLLVCQMQLSR